MIKPRFTEREFHDFFDDVFWEHIEAINKHYKDDNYSRLPGEEVETKLLANQLLKKIGRKSFSEFKDKLHLLATILNKETDYRLEHAHDCFEQKELTEEMDYLHLVNVSAHIIAKGRDCTHNYLFEKGVFRGYPLEGFLLFSIDDDI